jgi:hypothetical protein
MKITILAAALVATIGTTAFAQDATSTVDAYVTKSGSADAVYALDVATDLSYDVADNFTALAGAEVAVDQDADVTVTTWYLGADVAGVAVTVGKQDNLFTDGIMNQLGGNSLGTVADAEYSIIASANAGTMFAGYDSTTETWTNVQASTVFTSAFPLAHTVVVVVDYQNTGADWAVGADVVGSIGNMSSDIAVTFVDDTVAYETALGYRFGNVGLTGFTGGSDKSDMFDYAGAGVITTVGGVDLWAEAVYEIDTQDTDLAVGVAFTF